MKKNIFLLLLIVMLLAGCEKGGKSRPTVSVSPTATISPTAILTPTPTPTPTKMVLVSDMSFPNHVFHNLEHRLRYMTMPVPAKHTAFVQEISGVEKQLYEGNIVLLSTEYAKDGRMISRYEHDVWSNTPEMATIYTYAENGLLSETCVYYGKDDTGELRSKTLHYYNEAGQICREEVFDGKQDTPCKVTTWYYK